MLLTIVLYAFATICVLFALCVLWDVGIDLLDKYREWRAPNLSSPADTGFYSTKWSEIRNLSNTYSSCPLAIIYASNLLDHALKKRGCRQEKIAQKLKSANHIFSNKRQIWKAIELRNKIVHNTYTISFTEQAMREALQSYRQALVDLKVL